MYVAVGRAIFDLLAFNGFDKETLAGIAELQRHYLHAIDLLCTYNA